MPFVVRDVRAITGLTAIDTDKLMNLILDAFQYSTTSKREALFSHLKSLGVEHTRTFYKNVHSFGSANQSLELYDSNSCYEYVSTFCLHCLKLETDYRPRRTLGDPFRNEDNDVHVVFAAPSNRDHDVEFVGRSQTNAYYQVYQNNLLHHMPSVQLSYVK